MNLFKVAVVIPVLNGGEVWRKCFESLLHQVNQPFQILIIDSGSTDGSLKYSENSGANVIRIDKEEFDHGATRQKGANLVKDSDIVVFLTQDAILLEKYSISKLISAFDDPDVGLAYGRQIPHQDSGHIEAFARYFNYPSVSRVITPADVPDLGIKAAFNSNSFAAYRIKALFQVGGFPERLIISEDMVVAARMLQANWSVSYVAEACVQHSHCYSWIQEFQRYFDIGVFHQDQSWILEDFGKPEGEGTRYVASELTYLFRNAPWLIPPALGRTGAKFIGYKLGKFYSTLPHAMRRRFSMHHRYWDR